MIRPLALASLGLALAAMPVLAQQAPAPAAPEAAAPAAAQPAAAIKLSEVLAKIEAEPGFLRFDDIEWDGRDSLWDIDYLGTGGRKVSVSINGATGEPVIE